MIQDKVREHPFSPSESIHAIFSKTAFPLIELWKIALHPLFIGVTQFSGPKNWGMSRHGITVYVSQSGTIACVGYSFGLTDYKADGDDWVRFLDGFVLEL